MPVWDTANLMSKNPARALVIGAFNQCLRAQLGFTSAHSAKRDMSGRRLTRYACMDERPIME